MGESVKGRNGESDNRGILRAGSPALRFSDSKGSANYTPFQRFIRLASVSEYSQQHQEEVDKIQIQRKSPQNGAFSDRTGLETGRLG